MSHITKAQLENLVTRINATAGTPTEQYTRTDDGRLKANEGCYYLAGAYGGWKLEQMGAQGCRDITSGYDTKRELEGKLRAFLAGLNSSKGASSLQKCERYELHHPGATYSNPEWGYPGPIGSVRTYPGLPWGPLNPSKEI